MLDQTYEQPGWLAQVQILVLFSHVQLPGPPCVQPAPALLLTGPELQQAALHPGMIDTSSSTAWPAALSTSQQAVSHLHEAQPGQQQACLRPEPEPEPAHTADLGAGSAGALPCELGDYKQLTSQAQRHLLLAYRLILFSQLALGLRLLHGSCRWCGKPIEGGQPSSIVIFDTADCPLRCRMAGSLWFIA